MYIHIFNRWGLTTLATSSMEKFSTLHIVRPSFRLGLWSWVMLNLSYQSYRIHQSVQWCIHACAMPWSYVCHHLFTCAMTAMCVPWFVDACAMTYSCVIPDLFMCVPWPIYECAGTYPSEHNLKIPSAPRTAIKMRHDSLYESRLTPTTFKSWRESFTRVTWLFEISKYPSRIAIWTKKKLRTFFLPTIFHRNFQGNCPWKMTWLVYASYMTRVNHNTSHLDVQHDSFKWWHALSVSVPWFLEITTWLVNVCAMTPLNRNPNLCAQHDFSKWRHALCMSAPWLLGIVTSIVYACSMTFSNRDTTHLCARLDFFRWQHALSMCVPYLLEIVTSHVYTCNMTFLKRDTTHLCAQRDSGDCLLPCGGYTYHIGAYIWCIPLHTVTHCNKLQHTATHMTHYRSKLQDSRRCNILRTCTCKYVWACVRECVCACVCVTHSCVQHVSLKGNVTNMSFEQLACIVLKTHICHVPRVTVAYTYESSDDTTLLWIHMSDVTHSYVWHDSFLFVTWLFHVRHDLFIGVTTT